MKAHNSLAIALAGSFLLSACSSVAYRADSSRLEYLVVRGGHRSRIEKTWPLRDKLHKRSENPDGAAVLVAFPLDLVFGWRIRKDFKSFDVHLKAKIMDQNGIQVADFPIEVELEGCANRILGLLQSEWVILA